MYQLPHFPPNKTYPMMTPETIQAEKLVSVKPFKLSAKIGLYCERCCPKGKPSSFVHLQVCSTSCRRTDFSFIHPKAKSHPVHRSIQLFPQRRNLLRTETYRKTEPFCSPEKSTWRKNIYITEETNYLIHHWATWGNALGKGSSFFCHKVWNMF